MYKQQPTRKYKGTLKRNETYKGETIEQKIFRITNNKEPIKDGAPQIYTDRSEGVKPEYDIRTDRFEVAIDAMSVVDKTYKAQREQRIGERTYDTMTPDQQKEFNTKFPKNKHNTNNGGTPASSTTSTDKPD